MVKMCPSFSYEHRNWIWIIATVYVSCTALRLARFNVETTEEDVKMAYDVIVELAETLE